MICFNYDTFVRVWFDYLVGMVQQAFEKQPNDMLIDGLNQLNLTVRYSSLQDIDYSLPYFNYKDCILYLSEENSNPELLISAYVVSLLCNFIYNFGNDCVETVIKHLIDVLQNEYPMIDSFMDHFTGTLQIDPHFLMVYPNALNFLLSLIENEKLNSDGYCTMVSCKEILAGIWIED